MRDTTSFNERDGMIQKGTADLIEQSTADLAGQTTGDWIDREVIGGLITAEGEVVGGFIRDNDTQAGTAVGEGISLATETIIDSGVEGLSNGFGEGISGVDDILKNDAFNVGG